MKYYFVTFESGKKTTGINVNEKELQKIKIEFEDKIINISEISEIIYDLMKESDFLK